MKNLTIESLDRQHIIYVFKKYIEEYGLTDGQKVAQQALREQAQMWGIDYGREVQNAN